MNRRRLAESVIRDFWWKIIFTIIFFLFLTFFANFFARVSYLENSITMTERYLEVDLAELNLERYEVFANRQIEDNFKLNQSEVNHFWQEQFEESGLLGSVLSFITEINGEVFDLRIILGKAYNLGNYKPSYSSEVLLSPDINESELELIKNKFNEIDKFSFASQDFFLNDTTAVYTSNTPKTIYYFTGDYIALMNNPKFQVYSDMLMDRLISIAITPELSKDLQDYAWQVYGGHFKIDSFVENYELEGSRQVRLYKLMLVFFALCLFAIVVFCLLNMHRLLNLRMSEYIAFRQFGSTRLETFIDIFLYIITFFLPTLILHFITNEIIYLPGLLLAKNEYSLFLTIIITLISLVFTIYQEKKIDQNFQNNYSVNIMVD